MERAVERTRMIASHLAPSAQAESEIFVSETAAQGKNGDDIVIVKAVRTAVTKAKRGQFKDTTADRLLIPVFKSLLATGIDPSLVGDIVIGNVLPPSSQAATEVRVAALLAGFPKEVPVTTVNRQCSSGLQALANVASAIKAGYYEVGVAGGVESMSSFDMSSTYGSFSINEDALGDDMAKGCYMTMGQTSEEVASRYNISRKQQDEFSVLSHSRAAAAIKAGRFKDEIVPVTTIIKDPKTSEEKTITVDTDDGVRAGTTYEALAKLKPVFKDDGSTTAGNASQTSDGAAAMLVMKRSTAERLKLPIQGIFRSFAVVGVEPAIMGVGPAEAIPAALKKAGLTTNDIDVFEINEAFASQCTYCLKKLNLSLEKVNPNGGGIAIGHPLGCTGARLTSTLLHELARRKGRYGVVSMCIGSGMGAAAVFEREN